MSLQQLNIFVHVVSSGQQHAWGCIRSQFVGAKSIFSEELSGIVESDDRVDAFLQAIYKALWKVVASGDTPRLLVICTRDVDFLDEMAKLSALGELGLRQAFAASGAPNKVQALAMLNAEGLNRTKIRWKLAEEGWSHNGVNKAAGACCEAVNALLPATPWYATAGASQVLCRTLQTEVVLTVGNDLKHGTLKISIDGKVWEIDARVATINKHQYWLARIRRNNADLWELCRQWQICSGPAVNATVTVARVAYALGHAKPPEDRIRYINDESLDVRLENLTTQPSTPSASAPRAKPKETKPMNQPETVLPKFVLQVEHGPETATALFDLLHNHELVRAVLKHAGFPDIRFSTFAPDPPKTVDTETARLEALADRLEKLIAVDKTKEPARA